MSLSFPRALPEERDALAAFVAADTYPYNAVPAPTVASVAAQIDAGYYTGTFWIVRDAGVRVGIVQYQDASATHAEVHIRLHTPHRGRGIGTWAVAWLTDHLFRTYPAKHRVEGWTRADNRAMRSVFARCGYVEEAYLRQDFAMDDGTFHDKVGCAVLRTDWQSGTTTPVVWQGEDGRPYGSVKPSSS